MKKQCSVEGCNRLHYGKGLCQAHYQRQWLTGSVGSAEIEVHVLGRADCEVEGCDRLHMARGLCNAHWQRWRKTGEVGSAEVFDTKGGADHFAWTGDDATYPAMHQRLSRQRGPASDYPCQLCGEEEKPCQWAYMHIGGERERTEINRRGYLVPYSLDLEDYMPLCVSCHNTFDRWPVHAATRLVQS